MNIYHVRGIILIAAAVFILIMSQSYLSICYAVFVGFWGIFFLDKGFKK